MSFGVPDDLWYLTTHEWVRLDNDTAVIGITDFAQDELGDIVFVELPEVGDYVDQEEQFGTIESIKAVSDLYAPIAGTVVAINNELLNAPELVNEDNYGEGWILKVDPAGEPDMSPRLSSDEYQNQTA